MEWARGWGGGGKEIEGMGRRWKGKLAPSREGPGKHNWSTAGKGRHGPADEVRALGRMEICQELARGETGTVEREQSRQRHQHRRNPGRRNWYEWDEMGGKVDLVEVARLGKRKMPHLLQKLEAEV